METSSSNSSSNQIPSCGSNSRLEALQAASKSGACPCPKGQDGCICTNGICMKGECPNGICQRNHQGPPPSL